MYSLHNIAFPVARAVIRTRTVGASVARRTFSASAIPRTPALTEAITSDHREIERCYQEIVNSNDIEHQQRYGNQFIWELARHSVAEELILYPAMERYMPPGKGKEHAEKDREQHHTLKEFLKTFQNMKASDANYKSQLEELRKHLANHVSEEEGIDLPALEEALALEENRGSTESLAKTFLRTKAFVPSRSHPAAGENPYIEGPAGLPVAIFDHIADLFRKFPDGKISPNPSTK